MNLNDADIARYPEHAKLHNVKDASQKCGEFLEWLQGAYTLCQQHEKHDDGCRAKDGFLACGMWKGEYFPVNFNVQKVLAQFFGIDLRMLNEEKDAMLREFRAQNAKVKR